MKYKIILFDADDTLFDFVKSQEVAFLETLTSYQLQNRYKEIFATYVEISRDLWLQFEQGKISKNYLTHKRFEMTFEKHQLSLDAKIIGNQYFDSLAKNYFMIKDAVGVCQELSQYCRLGIVTNGIQSVQTQRLAASPLNPFIEFMVISDACGYAKPDARIFQYAMKLAEHEDVSSVLMVGDRLETDILGAQQSGMDSCWFNPLRIENHSPIQASYEIVELTELKEKLIHGR